MSSRVDYPDYPGDWAEQALCREVDTEVFFPEKGGSTKEAKSVCRSCLVRAECLTHALNTRERFGIWGGLSERERRSLLASQGIDLDEEHPPQMKGTAA